MTSKSFIDTVSQRSNIPRRRIAEVLDWVELCMKEEIVKGESGIKICDILFYPYIQKPRPVRNPKTMEPYTLKPDRIVKIKLSKDWKRICGNFRHITQEDFDKVIAKYFY